METAEKKTEIQSNYSFHSHHHQRGASQMLRKFESFSGNRDAHYLSRYGKPYFLPHPHLVWCIGSLKFQEKCI